MIPITFLAVTAYLIDDSPVDGRLDFGAELPVHVESGKTARESRWQMGDTLRLSVKYRALLNGVAAVTNCRNSLQALTTQRVLMPLWVAGFEAGDSPTVEADYYALIDDSGTAPAIAAHADLPFARTAYPLLVGVLKDRPDPDQLTGECVFVAIDFEDKDEYPITLPAYVPPNGLSDGAGNVRPLFPWRPNWVSPLKGQAVEQDVDEQEVGHGRLMARFHYTQPARRECEQYFGPFEGGEIWDLLSLFQDLGACRETIWLPGGMTDAALTANVGSADTAITVADSATVGTNRFLLIDDLVNRTPVKVTAVPDGTHLTLSGAVGTDYTKEAARLESLMLARFKSNRLTVKFQNGVADATIRFRELPWETAAASAGETFGTTQGSLTKRAYYYHFFIDYPGATQEWHFTDWERDLDFGGETLLHGFFQHDTIKETDTMEQQQVSLESVYSSGNPLALLLPFSLEWPLQLDIYEIEVDGSDAINERRMFGGEIDRAEFDGPYIKASGSTLGSIFDRNITVERVQTGCNTHVFSARCGLDRDDWKWQGTVVSYNASTGELALKLVARVSGATVTLPIHRFAGGEVWFGAGTGIQSRYIADNAAAVVTGGPNGTTLTIVVGSAFTDAPAVGATVYMNPGCAGRYQEDCIDFFNNGETFVGCPWIPMGTPVARKNQQLQGAGGKK